MDSRCCLLIQVEGCLGKKPCCSFLRFSGAYIRALALLMIKMLKDKCRALFSSRGCLGCCSKPTEIIGVYESPKGLTIQGRTAMRPSPVEDFWSTSTGEMDNSAVQSQGSISSISTSNQTFDPHSNAGSTSNPPEFVNHGLLLWNQTRQQWIGNQKSQNRKQVQEPRISWNATYESLLGTNKPLPQPIPLPEMVDFLVDVWEQEGLYD
ncbi:uncharacterized protein LOC100254371 isoform X3 [Vitis vinifera]|uniref:uncharacterized protein LOC100254371 isoform X3 n=1 Tax=Vitis vinifera TaxID=29760 RepID=UPI00053F48AE|nr:uncharacterized protein LOC100254371 isoform X3 [Vitis vinifera]|eukprot:XP_010648664.1 PREDICTED: uncharacterized protein LOC100254371 isoform X2 [Vitis vinifera]